ncbi:MAG: hypothetical protein J6T80_07645 [Paludibacteraceae bacterium]|nr:hypothetical protein [Paludibacteraceae bacterium]
MNSKKKILKNAKEAYEDLLELYCDLCKTIGLVEAKEIINTIAQVVEEVKQNYFFPVSLSSVYDIHNQNADSITKETRVSAAKELYEWLASLLFQFEEANIVSMRPYMKVLEYGRTYIPYSLSLHWGEDYRKDKRFSHEKFYFAITSELYRKNEKEYEEYAQELRKEISSVRSIFPKEKALPKKFREHVQKEMMDSQREYQSYIEKNYAPIKHAFSNYNKRFQLYLHQRDEKLWIVMINGYESTMPECKVYPKEVDVMFRFHNVESEASRINRGGLAGYGDGYGIKYMFDEQSIHHELNKIFVKYASEPDLLAYVMYILRGRLSNVKYVESRKEMIISDDIYIICLDESLTRDNVHDKIKACKNKYKGLILRFRPSQDMINMLQNANLSYICAEEMGNDIVNNQNGEMIHLYIKERISRLKIAKSENANPSAALLRQRLDKCPKGKEGWTEYEDIGADIFKYLFADDFRHFKYEIQSTTEDGIARRDMIVNNTYKTPPCFWEQMKEDYNAKVIIVDFKNYSKPLNTDVFYNVSKYFNDIVGHFAIIFSRNGLGSSAIKKQSKMLGENKLILCLTDTDIIEMIDCKERNQNPTDKLEEMYYTLCKKG